MKLNKFNIGDSVLTPIGDDCYLVVAHAAAPNGMRAYAVATTLNGKRYFFEEGQLQPYFRN